MQGKLSLASHYNGEEKNGAAGAALTSILLVASSFAAIMSQPAAALSDEELTLNGTIGGGGKLAFDYQAVSCPHLVTIVRAYVQAAVRGDATITLGLLRIRSPSRTRSHLRSRERKGGWRGKSIYDR